MRDVYLVAACRTPIGNFNGGLAPLRAHELGSIAIKEVLNRAGIKPEQVDEVIFGNVSQAGEKQGPARQASINAGIPVETPAYSINILCGSGLKSVILAAQSIMLGESDIIVAGGMESMTNAPYSLDKARSGYRMGHGTLNDTMISDGLTDAFNDYHMGITAENLAEKYNLSMDEQNEFALSSQHKAQKAIEEGRFNDEIVPVTIKTRKGDVVIDKDEFPRKDATIEGLSKLKPAFKKEGTVTAGNASGINDGAAAIVLASEEAVKKYGLKPVAKYISSATAGVEPSIMGIGPVPAVKKALDKGGLKLSDIGLIEANEAFAAQSLSVGKELGFNTDILNVNGGAIALGHPIGASGARILTTLLYEMKRRNTDKGLATLCVGGGMGVALIVELVK